MLVKGATGILLIMVLFQENISWAEGFCENSAKLLQVNQTCESNLQWVMTHYKTNRWQIMNLVTEVMQYNIFEICKFYPCDSWQIIQQIYHYAHTIHKFITSQKLIWGARQV